MSETGFGIIGCGVIAPYHAKGIAETKGARLVAVSDVAVQHAERLAEEYGAQPYADYREMLGRDDIDVVCLCVPSGLRCEIVEACAAAGKHILSEKPLEVTTERIDRIIQAVDDAKVTLGCIFQSRFAEGPRLVRRAIETGRFGRLVMGDAYIKWYRTQEYYDGHDWRGTWKLDGGGALMNQGIHQVDLLLWFMGPVKRVQAQTALLGHENIEVEDLACAMLEFENGAFGVIEATTAAWPGHPARVEVHGTQGSAVIEDGRLKFWQFREVEKGDDAIQRTLGEDTSLGSGASDPTSSLSHLGHQRQIEDFVRAIEEGRPPTVEGKEGRRAVALIEAIYASAKSGKPIDL